MTDDNKKENPEEFSFIRQTIKEKPLNKKKMLYTSGFVAAMAVLFGVIAACTFALIEPHAQAKLNPGKPKQVTFPDDGDSSASDNEEQEEDGQDSVIIQERVGLELADYEALFHKMSVLASESSRSLVTVTSATSETDWFNELLESKVSGTGAVIADNGVEYLILTERRLVDGADHISVTFADGNAEQAELKSYDGSTGLAILSVEKRKLSENTRNAMSIAVLGNSNQVKKGEPIIAAGSPLDYKNAALFGNITSQGNYARIKDANYKVLTTDILGSTEGTGVLLNLKGEIVGIIARDYNKEASVHTVTAFAVSDLKSVIEKLSNGREIAYMGIRGMDVTPSIAEASGMPKGVFVEVEMDSPAMLAGIQNGDVITAINNNPVENMKAIQKIMLEFEPEQALNITVMRQGKDAYKEMKYVVTLGKVK